MSEMEHTADELVVIGRGELIAAESLTAFAARGTRGHVAVTTPAAPALRELLTTAGATVRVEGERLTVTGLAAERIGELAHRHRIPLHSLSTHAASLEEAFMELTADSVQYPAGESR
jgi:ABC-2 type transport system ATP-binding protein